MSSGSGPCPCWASPWGILSVPQAGRSPSWIPPLPSTRPGGVRSAAGSVTGDVFLKPSWSGVAPEQSAQELGIEG
jgi:hypothetical protein